jgi:pimeloyl-ACP methyl ester carboxylesterase
VNEHTVVSFDGTHIWYADSGGDGPVVVLLHGITVTSRSNFGVGEDLPGSATQIAAPAPTISSALLAAGARVVALDTRGHGRSGKSPDPDRYRGDAHTRDVVAVLDAIAEDAVDLVGYSMGSYTAARLLDREPRLRAAALCGSSSQFVEGIDQSPYGYDMYAWFHACGRAFQAGNWGDPTHEALRNFALEDPDHELQSVGAALLGLDPVPADRLSGAGVPVLVLNGGADDGPGGAGRLAALIPGAVAAVVGGADHPGAPHDPAYQAALLDFLGRRWPS